MNDSDHHAPAVATIEAARVLLERLASPLADLLHEPATSSAVPNFAEYIPRVSAAVSTGTRRVYGSYWNRVPLLGRRPITEVSASDISQLAEQIKAAVVKRKNARGGRGAAEHLIAALRCLYKQAIADGLLDRAREPGRPRAQAAPSAQHPPGPPDGRLEEILRVAASTGDDPALDALLLRLHAETACRRGGALALRTG